MAHESWTQYVTRVSGGAKNVEIARQVGLSESTITRWRDGKLPSPSVAVAFARAYGSHPLEALIAADYLTPEEMQEHIAIRFVPLSDLSDVELAIEILHRAEDAAARRIKIDERAAETQGVDLATVDEDELLARTRGQI